VIGFVAGDVVIGPPGDGVHLDQSSGAVPLDDRCRGPRRGVDSLQTGHPRVATFEHTVQGNHLAQLTAPVRSARPSLGVGARRDHSQVEVIEGTHLFDECQRLGEMCTRIEEDDLDTRTDSGDKVDEDAVLERAGEGEPGAEAVDRPGHDFLSRRDLEALFQGRRSTRGRRISSVTWCTEEPLADGSPGRLLSTKSWREGVVGCVAGKMTRW